jgi:hypothetical protein
MSFSSIVIRRWLDPSAAMAKTCAGGIELSASGAAAQGSTTGWT